MRKGCDRENILFRWVIWMFRRVVYCSGGLYDEDNNDGFSSH